MTTPQTVDLLEDVAKAAKDGTKHVQAKSKKYYKQSQQKFERVTARPSQKIIT